MGASLIAAYCDSICLFVTKVNTQEVAEVTCLALKELLMRIGSQLHSVFWSDVSVQVKLLLD